MREGADQLACFLAGLAGQPSYKAQKPVAGVSFGSPALMAELVEVLAERQLLAHSSLVVCSKKTTARFVYKMNRL